MVCFGFFNFLGENIESGLRDKMKNLATFILITLLSISCHAQKTISLKDATISINKSLGDISPNVNYIKDRDNALNNFVGIWIGEYNGKKYEVRFVKKTKYGENPMRDILIGRILVKDSLGNVIYSTLEKSDKETGMIGRNFQKDMKVYQLAYSGKNSYCGDYGILYIYFKDRDYKTLSLSFGQLPDIIVEEKCPKNFEPLIPYSEVAILRLNKQ